MRLNVGAEVRGGIGHFDGYVPEPNHTAFSIGTGLYSYPVAAVKNLRSDPPFLWPLEPRKEPVQVALKPIPVPFREPSRPRSRAASRNGHPRRTVRAEPEHIPPCMRIPNQNHANLASIHIHTLRAPSFSPSGGEGARRAVEGDSHRFKIAMHDSRVVEALHEPAGASNCRLPWESGAEDARTPDADAWSTDPVARAASGVRPIYRRFRSAIGRASSVRPSPDRGEPTARDTAGARVGWPRHRR